jgi:hypothetical protein
MICGSAAIQFSLMFYDLVVVYVSWRFLRKPYKWKPVMISGYVATQFSSKIFDSAGVYAPRRFNCQLQTNGISCKNLSTIQRSDQELQTSWAGTLVLSMVWVDKTMMVSSSNFSATPRKTASGNSCKILSTIQWSDQELWTIWAGTLVWPDELHRRLMAISLQCQGNEPLETPVKLWAPSNGRIKSYGPFEPVL